MKRDYVTVEVSYPAQVYLSSDSLDRRLEKLARRPCHFSGCGGGYRDIGWCEKTKKKAEKLAKRLRRVPNVDVRVY